MAFGLFVIYMFYRLFAMVNGFIEKGNQIVILAKKPNSYSPLLSNIM